ncbi:MAG: hypothetical protein H6684_03295 [Deltaproteobacteria bacterium]|nr:hypothetical protein [Deltaproteobacteria bacterium]
MRRFWCVFAVLLLGSPLAAFGADFGIGADLEYFRPLDPEMYGETMASNTWGRDIKDLSYSTGTDRNQFYGPNRPTGMLVPGLTQEWAHESGFSVKLAEKWLWLVWSPNVDVDIVFQRTMVPIELTPQWTFNKAGKVRPTVFVGGSANYVVTTIDGNDLYDQNRNENYPNETVPEDDDPGASGAAEPREYFRDKRSFGEDGWYLGAHAGAGVQVELQPGLYLEGTLRWSTIPIESIEAVRVREGNPDDWHWEEKELTGDAGGISASVGVMYFF